VAGAWGTIAAACQSFIQHDRVILERASDVTEAGIRGLLQQNRAQVVHFVGHAQARAANYTSIALQTAEGRARQLTASAAGNLFGAVGLCILQPCDDACVCFDAVARAIAVRGAAVVAVPRLREAQARARRAQI